MKTKNDDQRRISAGMGFGLRALRLALGYETAAAFARFLDVPAATVRRCERGQLKVTYRALPLGMALCDKAGFTLDWFFMGFPQGKRRNSPLTAAEAPSL